MPRTYLGEFEEVVLLMVAILHGEGYGVSVSQALEEHRGRIVTFGTVHNTLIRLDEKGGVRSELGGATAEHGGRRKQLFRITALVSQEIQPLRQDLWQLLLPNTLSLGGV
jgi:PadR family transcriptional regulator PadR